MSRPGTRRERWRDGGMVSWIEIKFNFNKIKTAPKFKRCERLGVEEVAGSLMEVLEGQVGNTIQLEVCLW